MKILSLFILTVGLSLSSLQAQDSSSTAFNFDDIQWMTGRWVGDGFGGVSEEIWSAPSAGSMVGVYKHFKDGEVTFYEILLIAENEGKPSLRLKHFNADLTAWEEKKDFVEFSFVGISENKLEFKGLVFELVADDLMEVRLKMKRGGEIVTEVFTFERKKF